MAKSLEGLHPVMRHRVESLLVDPEAVHEGITVVSAFRSVEYQARLFRDAVRRYGSEARARRWVAPPGRSNHGPKLPLDAPRWGIAVDFGIRGVAAVSGQWPPAKEAAMRSLGLRYGLRPPMAWEDWHFEPVEGLHLRLDSWSPGATVLPIASPPEPAADTDEEVEMFLYRESNTSGVKQYEGKGSIRVVPDPQTRDDLTELLGPVKVLRKQTVAFLEAGWDGK